MDNNPRKLKLRIETLDTDDVHFLREMIATRIKETEANKKLDPQERSMVVARYRLLFHQLDRRFPKSSGRENPALQFRRSVPGHVILIDDRVVGPIEDTISIYTLSDKLVAESKLVGMIGDFDGIRILKDRSGLNTEETK